MTRWIVRDLIARGALRVEDGNHGNDRPRPQEFVAEGVAFIRAADMTSGVVDFINAGKINSTARQRIRKGIGAPGDVILSHKGTVGRVAVAPMDAGDFVCSPQTTFWRSLDYELIDQRYLKYLLQSSAVQQQLKTLAGQTDMAPYVSLTDQRAMVIDLPTVRTQIAIGEMLGALDDKMAANQLAIGLIDSLMATLYRRATQGLVDEKPLFEVFDFDFGEAFKGEYFAELGQGRPLIRIRDLKTFRPQVWTTESRPGEVTVHPGDVLIGMDAEFRAVPWLGAPGLLNQRVCRVRGRKVGPAFAICSLREPLNALENEKSATTVIHLNKSDLARSVVKVPDASRLEEFEAFAEPMLASRVALALESARLTATREELLPMLMSGKVWVRDAEKIVEGVG